MEHLHDSTKRLLGLPDNDRIKAIEEQKWVGYPRASEILNRLTELLHHPPSHRMPNLLLVGETNNGKTAILNRFTKQHPAYMRDDNSQLVIPVLHIQAPPEPDERQLYEVILNFLGAPHRSADRVEKKRRQIIQLLKTVGVRVWIIDEIHNILMGSPAKQRLFLNVLKYLCNELQLPLVGAGIREAYYAIRSDPQLENRFEPAILPKWALNDEYVRLLASLEIMLPLRKPSRLAHGGLPTKILSMSDGKIGEITTILTRAAIRAVRTGEEQITDKTLSSIKYLSPTDRKNEFIG